MISLVYVYVWLFLGCLSRLIDDYVSFSVTEMVQCMSRTNWPLVWPLVCVLIRLAMLHAKPRLKWMEYLHVSVCMVVHSHFVDRLLWLSCLDRLDRLDCLDRLDRLDWLDCSMWNLECLLLSPEPCQVTLHYFICVSWYSVWCTFVCVQPHTVPCVQVLFPIHSSTVLYTV